MSMNSAVKNKKFFKMIDKNRTLFVYILKEQTMEEEKYIILGKTKSGENFRPSDWAERISGLNSKFLENKKLYYSNTLRPTQIDGINSLIVEKKLKELNLPLWNYVFSFAKENNLTIKDKQ